MSKNNSESIIIKTFTPIYDAIEDRIRIAINYQDIHNRIDFMLTRAFLLQILVNFDEYLHTYYQDDLQNIKNPLHIEAKDFYQENYSKNSGENKLSKFYTDEKEEVLASDIKQTQKDDFELYISKEDLLYSINLKYEKKTKLTIFELVSKNKYSAIIKTDLVMLKKLIESLKYSIPHIKWGISQSC